jgi:hypothetical protein
MAGNAASAKSAVELVFVNTTDSAAHAKSAAEDKFANMVGYVDNANHVARIGL